MQSTPELWESLLTTVSNKIGDLIIFWHLSTGSTLLLRQCSLTLSKCPLPWLNKFQITVMTQQNGVCLGLKDPLSLMFIPHSLLECFKSLQVSWEDTTSFPFQTFSMPTTKSKAECYFKLDRSVECFPVIVTTYIVTHMPFPKCHNISETL